MRLQSSMGAAPARTVRALPLAPRAPRGAAPAPRPRGGRRVASGDGEPSPTAVEDKAPEDAAQQAAAANGNGNGAEAAAPAPAAATSKGDKAEWDPAAWRADASALLPLEFKPLDGGELLWSRLKMAFALPWRRFKKGSVLAFKLEGEVSDKLQGRFAPGFSVPQICSALEKAAVDPRIEGIAVEIGPLAVGWARMQELRRYVELFKASGKYAICYMKIATEKEYYLASAFGEIYTPPSASIRLTGFSVAGTFLRGVLDKVGVEPQVKRIGAYKSAGDQLLRKDMSPEQREQLDALLENIYTTWVADVARARGKSEAEVVALLDQGVYDMKLLAEGGWIDGLRYEDEIIADLKKRTGGKEDEVTKVGLRKYASVRRGTFGLDGKKRIAVLRTNGAILGAASSATSSAITPDSVIPKLRALAKDKGVAAVVLRVDSPGGDALASDLMWREIKQLGAKKPVIACMGDVAASGGYYMSMAASAIVAAPLTITGSIGVVTGKFNLAELYARAGYSKELISRGRYAQLLAADNRPFSADEEELFNASAQYAYESFRDKAASSRGMAVDDMQAVAQGRVWSGTAAASRGLVDVVGGLWEAVGLAKQAAGIPAEERVSVLEVSKASTSPLALLSGGGASLGALVAAAALARGGSPGGALQGAVGGAAMQQLGLAAAAAAAPFGLSPAELAGLVSGLAQGQALAYDFDAAALASGGGGGLSSAAAAAAARGGGGGSALFDEEGGVGAALAATDAWLADTAEEWLL
ncbi:MAG: peptidase family S49-domain-containing protein [Monoraphidium minutum]|nr:MAG: peptidase family S49-domain-containing protein [Monoraphidium minutum]